MAFRQIINKVLTPLKGRYYYIRLDRGCFRF